MARYNTVGLMEDRRHHPAAVRQHRRHRRRHLRRVLPPERPPHRPLGRPRHHPAGRRRRHRRQRRHWPPHLHRQRRRLARPDDRHPLRHQHVLPELRGRLDRQGQLRLVPPPRARRLRRHLRHPHLAGPLLRLRLGPHDRPPRHRAVALLHPFDHPLRLLDPVLAMGPRSSVACRLRRLRRRRCLPAATTRRARRRGRS